MRESVNLFAYLDAGTGSMILQAVLGGAAAVALGWRVLWRRISTSRNKEIEEGQLKSSVE